MFVLTLRAQLTPYTSTYFLAVLTYAILLTFISVGNIINKRVAYGLPRHIDLGGEEVVVITGGASGLGLLIARVYGIRGVSVAVLDLNVDVEGKDTGEDVDEVEGVRYYRCDVGRREEVEETLRRVEEEVGISFSVNFLLLLLLVSANFLLS